MPDRSNGRGQTKCNPWSSKLGVGRGDNDPTPGKFTVKKPSGTSGEGPWMRPKLTQGCSASKEEEYGPILNLNYGR
jgi:hypothetical protein